MSILEAARSAYAAGLSILPVRDDGSKAPDVESWTPFKLARPAIDQMRVWDFARRDGFGVIAGPVSGYREVWDFDDADTFAAFLDAATAAGLGDVVQRIRAGYEDQTPRPGYRWIVSYPPDVAWKDEPFARRPGRPGEKPIVTLIETCTFSILAPSNGQTHETGKPYKRVSGGFDSIASYTVDERAALMTLARSFDRMPRKTAEPRPTTQKTVAGDRPGDDYNARATWPEILEPHGWVRVFDRGAITYWRRPGKTFGISATTNVHGSDLLWVFSSSTAFAPEKSYTKFGASAVLEHGGDFRQAALALSKQGYGSVSSVADREPPPPDPAPPPATPCALAETDAVFRRWLGDRFDLDVLHVVLAAAAAERLTGDPLWLLVVSGPGAAKTETVQALAGSGALITSSISSEGALLSGSARRETAKDATGGLLRRLGTRGVLVIKDATSILAMNRDTRAGVLAALREVHDGFWARNIGVDGGKTLTWTGRIVVIGAVTTAWDRAHDVVASMGDRFVLVRMDSTVGRLDAGRGACRNTGDERRMRADLSAAMAGVLATVEATYTLTIAPDEEARIVAAANLVTLARTGVEYDYRGDVVDAHAPEMPTRFAKQLLQIVRGGTAIGLPRREALQLSIRCARDSMPPLRLAILDDVSRHPGSHTQEIRKRLQKPRATTDRQLQALHMLGVLKCEEQEGEHRGQPVSRWHYSLVTGIDPDTLDPDSVPDLPPHTHSNTNKSARERETESQTESQTGVRIPTDLSGTEPEPAWVTEPAVPDVSDPIGAHDEED